MMSVLQNHPVILALGWTLLHVFWQAALIGLIIRLLWLFISSQLASWRYGLSLTAMLVVFTLAVVTFLSYQDQYVIPAYKPDLKIEADISKSDHLLVTGPKPALSGPALMPDLSDEMLTDTTFSFDAYLPYLVLFWGIGTFLMSLRLAGSWWYMRKVSRSGLITPDPAWEDRLQVLMRRMGLDKRVGVYFSSMVDAPLTFGHFKPLILFPVGLINQLSVEQVEAILLHELAHIRRWDYLVNWLQSILELFFFYHPAVWWLSGEVRKAREHCCDDLVLRQGGTSRKLYAKTLTQLAALSFKPKTKLVMSIQGIKDAFSQRVLRLYGHKQAVLDWRKPVLSIALGCMLMPFLLLIQPEVFTQETHLEKLSSFPVLLLGSDLEKIESKAETLPTIVPETPALSIAESQSPVTEEALEIAEAALYEQLQLEPVIDQSIFETPGRTMVPLPSLSIRDHIREYSKDQSEVEIKEDFIQDNQPLFIVDGQEIPADAPYRQISRDDIARFTWRYVPWSPRSMVFKKTAPKDIDGVIEIKTKDGNWPGGRPYWPNEIRDREILEKDYGHTWMPIGKAKSRKELGDMEGKAFLPGENMGMRKINLTGIETYSVLDGRVLKKGEVVEVNRHTIFGGRRIPIIGLYDGEGQLMYGSPTPEEVADRTMVLQLKEGYQAVIGKYPCDNRFYLRTYSTIANHHFDYNLHQQLHQGFEDVVARKALRFCDREQENNSKGGHSYQSVLPEPLFIIDGVEIPTDETYTVCARNELSNVKFLKPEEAKAQYGRKGKYGVAILRSQNGKWKGGKPYAPLYEEFEGDPKSKRIPQFAGSSHFFIDGIPVSESVFGNYNFFSFFQGTLLYPAVGAIYGLGELKVELEKIRQEIGNTGIAYELRPGLIVVEYLEQCRNTINIAAVCTPLTNKVATEKFRLRKAISWEKNELKCAKDGSALLKMIDQNMAHLKTLIAPF